jgi:predicted transcriptional regulator
MTRDPIACDVESTLSEVAGVMEKYQIRRVPIIEAGRLVGIVSVADLAMETEDASLTGRVISEISRPSERLRPVA